jgi:hypothetical protein
VTKEAFLAFYPQFAAVPDAVVTEYVDQSNARFGDFLDMTEEARRLYVAHKLTLYAQTYSDVTQQTPTAIGMKKLAGSGVAAQALSKTVGGVSVTKSEGSAVSGISGFAEWKQTEFGLQLISIARLMTPTWIP